MEVLLPKVGVTRAGENPGFAIAESEARILRLGGQNVLDSLTDEAITTGDENDVRHVVRVWAGGRGGKGRDEWRREGNRRGGYRIYGRISRPTLDLAHYMKRAPNVKCSNLA